MKKLSYINGGVELLDQVGPMWMELNSHHSQKSTHFSEKFDTFEFEMRKKAFLEKNRLGRLNIQLVKDDETKEFAGYCVTSISKEIGEIESLYLKPEYRGMKIGDRFLTDALSWLDENKVEKKIIGVAVGNEEVLSLYQKYGFYPMSIKLIQK